MPNPYCQKRLGTYYLRLRIPMDMRPFLGTQVLRSLKTGRAEEARFLAAGMVAAAPRVWAVLRQEVMVTILGKSLEDLTPEDLSRANLPAIVTDVDRLTDDEKKAVEQRFSELMREAFDGMTSARADLSIARLGQEMLQHGQNAGLNKALTLVNAGGATRSPVVEPPPAPTELAKPANPKGELTLGDLANAFFKTKKQGVKSQISYRGAIKGFEALTGSKPIREITEEDLVAYRDNVAEQKGRDGRTEAARATVLKNLGHIKAVLTWASNPERRIIPHNPGVHIMGPEKPKGATDDGVRLAFDETQLVDIFRSPIYTGCIKGQWKTPGPYIEREDRYYFFLAMFLTGARNDELVGAGLYELAGMLCLDLRLTGKKTPAGPRVVPILPELRATGFVDWAEARLASGGKLFRGPHAVIKWGDFPSRYLRDIGVGGRLHSAYSLRHSHRQMLRGSGLSDELIDKTFGHEGVKVGKTYGRGPVSRQEAEAWLSKVRCSIDLSHLYI